MTSEELFLIDKKISENRDEVIISFGPFDGLAQIHRVDMMLFDHIPEDIGGHEGHEVNIDDTNGQFFTYGKNAEELFLFMKPMLLQFDFLRDALVYLRFNKDDGTFSELEFKLNEVR